MVDNDETVIPRSTQSHGSIDDFHELVMTLNSDSGYAEIERQVESFECGDTNRALEAYMDRLGAGAGSRAISFYFQQAFYLSDSIFDDLLEQLADGLDRHQWTGTAYNLSISTVGDLNMTFSILSEDEHAYGVKLTKLNKRFIRPFMRQHEDKLARVSRNYRRVFALLSRGDNQFTMGKSIHMTTHTRNVCVHTLCGKRDQLVQQSVGHLSHFRRFFLFRKFILFSVKQLIFDFNYFNCYVKPILNKY